MLSLTVINFITGADIAVFIEVEDGENLSVVRHQGFTDHFAALNELLEHFEHNGDDLSVTRVERG